MKETSTLETLLLERIALHGPMPFAAYMQMALYHPRSGYYAQSEPKTGWAGDFVTSPELDTGFGQLWARGLEEIWRTCGSPPEFVITEVGPGEGGFASSVYRAAQGQFKEALALRLVERNPKARERQALRLGASARIEWVGSIVNLSPVRAGVLFANEVLDNLPVHLVEKRDGVLWEVCVTAAQEQLATALLPPSNPELERFLHRCGVVLPEGHRMEVALAAESFVRRLASGIRRGALLLVDYGDEATALAGRPQGSLVCYSPGGADDEPLDMPGRKDITSHVNWTAVRHAGAAIGLEMMGPRLQREVLLALGLGELDRALEAQYRNDLVMGDGAGAVAALSRRQALAALADPGGLGAAGVMAGLKGMPTPPFLA
jgi:SAM-dependent MidA family methyltransferase